MLCVRGSRGAVVVMLSGVFSVGGVLLDPDGSVCEG